MNMNATITLCGKSSVEKGAGPRRSCAEEEAGLSS
jgi:hypothetical protein